MFSTVWCFRTAVISWRDCGPSCFLCGSPLDMTQNLNPAQCCNGEYSMTGYLPDSTFLLLCSFSFALSGWYKLGSLCDRPCTPPQLSRLCLYSTLLPNKRHGTISRKPSARTWTCGASKQRLVIFLILLAFLFPLFHPLPTPLLPLLREIFCFSNRVLIFSLAGNWATKCYSIMKLCGAPRIY